ncbi:fungal specific transcription factor domain-containing protein [Niveomyces insectorum RCEF 264]|uniref:Fungal specific transcription factor domain-containing protein n=1 Tax=Niveomyces insectorum RCEF 264 TaxID=1081102 RepID=A0A168ACM3_9HYPO|nr:fungal specific transcription factor domain-containing protein [Niveomyces insectorum RCEF 264]
MNTENGSDRHPGQFAFLVTGPEASAQGPRRVRVSPYGGFSAARCAYAAPYHRGREPSRVSVGCANPTSIGYWSPPSNAASAASLQEAMTPALHNGASNGSGSSTTEEGPPEVASRASPEAPTTDLQGHYVGPASGVSFLLRVQHRLHRGDRMSATFTFGDAPLPDYDPVPSVMLSAEAAAQLVAKFFDYTMPVDRFFHRPTIEAWCREFSRTMGAMEKTDEAPARCAVMWMIFAMAQEHMAPESDAVVDDRSIRYFLAADYHLSKARGAVTLSRFQARLCQCYWLLGRSRVNHCWELFGSTARLALALGLHRKRSGRSLSPTQLECSRKTFWSAYHLDTYLTMVLGRPPIFHNEDIDQELPSGIDDDELIVGHMMSQGNGSYSVALAPNKVLRDMYPIRPLSEAQQCALATQYLQALEAWRTDVPAFLCVDSKDAVPLIPIFQRQRDTLNITYWHTIILTQRPFLLTNFSNIQNSIRRSYKGNSKEQIENGVKRCLEAALHIVDLVEGRCKSHQMSRSFWGTFYFGFSAVVVLYVYTIQEASSPPEVYQTFLDAASRCHDQLSRISGPESIGSRYCLVLEELQIEAKRKLQGELSPPLPFTGRENIVAPRENDPRHPFYAQNEHRGEEGGEFTGELHPNAAGYSTDLTSWIEFESMVRMPFYLLSHETALPKKR